MSCPRFVWTVIAQFPIIFDSSTIYASAIKRVLAVLVNGCPAGSSTTKHELLAVMDFERCSFTSDDFRSF